MATYNLTMKHFNGSEYDIMYPQTTIDQVVGDIPADRLEGTINLSTQTEGVLPVSKGGTGFSVLGEKIVLTTSASGQLQQTNAAATRNLLEVPSMTVVSVTLTRAGWNSNSQTVAVDGVLDDEDLQVITPTPTIASQSMYISSGVRCTNQGTNTLTFTCESVPTSNLGVYVVIQGVPLT